MNPFQQFADWLKNSAWVNILHWFGFAEQKLASFLYPIFKDSAKIVHSDLLKDFIDGIPVVVAALGGGYGAALSAATGYILPLLEKQAIELEQHVIGALANALIGQAKAAQQQAAEPTDTTAP